MIKWEKDFNEELPEKGMGLRLTYSRDDVKAFISKKLEEQEKVIVDFIYANKKLYKEKEEQETRLNAKINEWQDDYIEMEQRFRKMEYKEFEEWQSLQTKKPGESHRKESGDY